MPPPEKATEDRSEEGGDRGRLWKVLLFGTIGATVATTFAVAQLRQTMTWFSNQSELYEEGPNEANSDLIPSVDPEPPIHGENSSSSSSHMAPSPPQPKTYEEATYKEWQLAMSEVLNALERMKAWDLVKLPPRQNVVGCKWVFKIKTKSEDQLNVTRQDQFQKVTINNLE
ncbi:uncharacterized protein LOC116252212 isoform X1 [Nymphaea colorata]|nr:uncharacterized protein LOC116252212 isoform X1 [Nymphaea colorata]